MPIAIQIFNAQCSNLATCWVDPETVTTASIGKQLILIGTDQEFWVSIIAFCIRCRDIYTINSRREIKYPGRLFEINGIQIRLFLPGPNQDFRSSGASWSKEIETGGT